MAKQDINRIIFTGIVTGDANATESGERSSTLFTVACKDGWEDKTGNESTSFFRCALSSPKGGFATKMAPYIKKGTRVLVDGRLRTWSTKDEASGKYSDGHRITVDKIQLLGGNRAAGEAKPAETAKPAVPPANELPLDIGSDDLPF